MCCYYRIMYWYEEQIFFKTKIENLMMVGILLFSQTANSNALAIIACKAILAWCSPIERKEWITTILKQSLETMSSSPFCKTHSLVSRHLPSVTFCSSTRGRKVWWSRQRTGVCSVPAAQAAEVLTAQVLAAHSGSLLRCLLN